MSFRKMIPSQRQSGFTEFTTLARSMAPRALYRLQKLAETHPDAAIRIAADKIIIERAWGRPVTPVAIDAGTLGEQSFVLRAPVPEVSADAWEQAVELERAEYEVQPAELLGAPAATPEAPGGQPEAARAAPEATQEATPEVEVEAPAAAQELPAATPAAPGGDSGEEEAPYVPPPWWA